MSFESTLGDRLVWSGFAERDRYVALLNDSDIVVSTADHEFFGISVVEAVAAGCFPVLPNRLSYPELIPRNFHEEVFYAGSDPMPLLRSCLLGIHTTRSIGRTLAEEMLMHSVRRWASPFSRAR